MGLALPLLVLLPLQVAPGPTDDAFDPARQVRWEHTLDDALRLAQDEGRALLIAINADGESASEAIVRERYRDPAWVANTRPFVCVVGSVFRHTPRDYDDEGRRIPCPRLGEVTCGEHIAIEPLVHDGPLKGAQIDLFGEQVGRISPRHALVADPAASAPFGEKLFDLFLLFDLGELDRALASAAAGLEPRPTWAPEVVSGPVDQAQLRTLAGERDGGARSFFERWIQRAGPRDLWASTTAILHGGDRGSLGALRALVGRAQDPRLMARVGYVADTLNLERELGAAIRTKILSIPGEGAFEGEPQPAAAPWLETLCRLDPGGAATRDLALSFLAFGSPAELRAVQSSAGALELTEALEGVRECGGAWDLDEFLIGARSERVVLPGTVEPELATADELVEVLEVIGRQLKERPGDPALQAQLGRGLLNLARRRIEGGGAGGGIAFLLEDARDNLLTAARSLPGDATLWLDLARVSYYRADFEAQERHAQAALEALAYAPGSGPLHMSKVDAPTVDALRWLGDAIARRIPEQASAPAWVRATAQARGVRALAAAATGPGADATDWESLASFCRAHGRPVAAARLLREGLERYPESDPLRALFGSLLSAQPDVLLATYEQLARAHPESGSCVWYVGYSAMLLAEWQRRGEQPWLSGRAYQTAEQSFRRTIELNEGFRESSEFFLARCALGRGFAHLLGEDRASAAGALVDAARARPDTVSIGDGLGRETVDLVDGVLELRAAGPSPVDPLAWLDQLAEADPENSAWPRLVSDAELREALRAVGRGEPDVAEPYVRVAVEAGRRAVALEGSEENGRALAQAATVLSELLLAPEAPGSEALDEVRALVLEAGPHLGLDAGIQPVEADGLRLQVAGLREALGVARPVLRPGR